ncbi:MAG: cytidine deaminase [Bacillota bacterium]|nr:cytidine deaminase [Bacillota bacterium]
METGSAEAGPSPETFAIGAEEVARLLEAARQVARNAWAPYSHFLVGAAVLDDDGRLFVGCNVEVASYRLTTCAEQAAVAAAVAAGARRIRAVAVVSPGRPECLPCGACRQTLAEFAGPGLPVVLEGPGDRPHLIRLEELLPRAFRLDPAAVPAPREAPAAPAPGLSRDTGGGAPR